MTTHTPSYHAISFALLTALCIPIHFAHGSDQGQHVYYDRFEWKPDLEGPEIEITPPGDWTQSNIVKISFKDDGGIATVVTAPNPGAPSLDSLQSMIPLFEPTTEIAFDYKLTDANGLLGGGTVLATAAQDVFGNFSRKSTEFVVESPITAGKYFLNEPYVSESIEFEHCPLSSNNGPYTFETSEIDVTAFYGRPNFHTDRCAEGTLCLQFLLGDFIGQYWPSGSPWSMGPVLNVAGLSELNNSEVQTPFSSFHGFISQDNNWRVASSVYAVFSGTTPNEIALEIEIACFIEKPNDPPNGCAFPEFSSCLHEHVGTFTIAGTLQEE